MIPIGKGGRVKITQQCLEAQAYRCGVCQRELSLDVPYDHPARPAMVKIDRSKPMSYQNGIVCCHQCSGTQSRSPTLLDFYEEHQRGVDFSAQTRAQAPISEEVLAAIAEQARLIGYEVEVPRSLGRAPLHRARDIAVSLARNHHRFSPQARVDARQRKRARTALWMTTGNRRRLAEAQNHRCCYCHAEFYYGVDPTNPRYPTWEHVVSCIDGGYSRMKNCVIACYTCNTLRSVTDLSAEDFYLWVAANPQVIQKKVDQLLLATEMRIRRRGLSYHEVRERNKPFFDYD